MSISKETKVGVLAAIAIAILAIGYNYLKGENLLEKTNIYYGKYDKIEGLFASNPVIVRGYKIGHVSSVEMDNETLELTVGIKVPQDIKIPANSTMKIINNDLIGSKAVEIIFGDDEALAQHGDYLNAAQDQGIEAAISGVLTPLTQRVNSVLGNIDTAVAGADLETTLKDASLALKSFKETADKLNKLLDGKGEQIDGILADVRTTTTDLKGLSPKIDEIITDIDGTAKELKKVDFEALGSQIESLTAELETTTKAINNSEGTLGMLVNDKEMYNKIDAAVVKLKQLLEDIEKYPRRYTGITERQRKKGDKAKEESK
jgi:phospholipid/cholesterol/gamma-HCH transport system substrate-binding protein